MVIIKKIIFLSGTPISKIVGDKIDPYWYQDHGFDVEFWDLTRIYYKENNIAAYFGGNPKYKYLFPNEVVFTDKKEVNNKFKQIINTKTIIWYIDYQQQYDIWLLRLFKMYDILYISGNKSITLQDKTTEIPEGKKSYNNQLFVKIYNKIKRNSSSVIYAAIKNSLLHIIYSKLKLIKKLDYMFSSGTCGKLVYSNSAIKYVSIPSPDVSWDYETINNNEEYCVYIENSFHYFPDAHLNNIKNECCINTLTTELNSAFNIIENQLGVKIVIAATGKYKFEDNIFGGRKICYSNTNSLIQNAKLVIGHFSHGISQAIVSYKPILLLLSNSIDSKFNVTTNNVGDKLKIIPVLIDDLYKVNLNNIKVDRDQYRKVIQSYYNDTNIVVNPKNIILETLNSYVFS